MAARKPHSIRQFLAVAFTTLIAPTIVNVIAANIKSEPPPKPTQVVIAATPVKVKIDRTPTVTLLPPREAR